MWPTGVAKGRALRAPHPRLLPAPTSPTANQSDESDESDQSNKPDKPHQSDEPGALTVDVRRRVVVGKS